LKINKSTILFFFFVYDAAENYSRKTLDEFNSPLPLPIYPPRFDFIILRVYLAFYCQETTCTMRPELDCSCTKKMHHRVHSSSPRSMFLVSFFSCCRTMSFEFLHGYFCHVYNFYVTKREILCAKLSKL